MKQVCVLGNGQLGRMLRQAGEPLGIAVWPVGLDAEPEAVPFHQSVITAEIERWPETALTRELARHNAFVNRDGVSDHCRPPDAKAAFRQARPRDRAVAAAFR